MGSDILKSGRFYFISDDFYNNFDKEKKLMQNKENVDGKPANRPCFFSFPDSNNSEIYWCVPISSKVEKYQNIYDKKIEKQIAKGIISPKCNTIKFGDVMGKKRAFLIQNMFPVTQEYVQSTYIDKNTHNEVTIDNAKEKEIIKNAKEVLKLSKRGIQIIFGDVHKIYSALSAELEDKQKGISNVVTSEKSKTAYFSRKQLNTSAQKIKEKEKLVPQQPTHKKSQGLE